MTESLDAHIVLVEPEPSVANYIRDALEDSGYKVQLLDDGQQALRQVSRSQPALMIIDAELPDMSGYEVCRTTQSMNYHIPVILLSGMGSAKPKRASGKSSTVPGNPDALLKKPIEQSRLLSVVSEKLNLNPAAPGARKNAMLNLGSVQIDLSESTVYTTSGTNSLTKRELELLKFLNENADRPVDRKTLLENVWEYQNTTNTRTVDVHIAKLRSKIEATPSEPEHIITIHGTGYMLKT